MEKVKNGGNEILGTGKIGRLLIRFAVPSVIALTVNSLYNIIDQIFIGQSSGIVGNGATNVVFLVTLFTLSLSMLFGDGAAARFNLKCGAGKKEEAAFSAGTGLTAVTALSVICLTVFSIFLNPALRLFGATPSVLPLAERYGRIIVFGVPFIMISTALNSLIRADGSPLYAMLSMTAGAALNVALDPLLIFCLGLGIEGAAYATIISQFVSFAISAAYLFRFKSVRLKIKNFAVKIREAGSIMLLGLSGFIDQISFALVMAVGNNIMVICGAGTAYGSDITLAVFGIAMKIEAVLYSITLGVALGMQPIAGYNYGAGNFARVKRVCIAGISAASAVSAVGMAVFLCFPRQLMSIFGGGGELYFDFAEKFFRTYFMLICFLGFQTATAIYFQAVGKPVRSAVIALTYQVVMRVLGALSLAAAFGLFGALIAGPLSDIGTAAVAAALLVPEIKGLSRRQKEGETSPPAAW